MDFGKKLKKRRPTGLKQRHEGNFDSQFNAIDDRFAERVVLRLYPAAADRSESTRGRFGVCGRPIGRVDAAFGALHLLGDA